MEKWKTQHDQDEMVDLFRQLKIPRDPAAPRKPHWFDKAQNTSHEPWWTMPVLAAAIGVLLWVWSHSLSFYPN